MNAPMSTDPTTPEATGALACWLQFLHRRHLAGRGDPRDLPCLMAWATRLWEAVDQGDLCVALPSPSPLPASPVIGSGHDGRATVLVQDLDHLYLHRLWFAEYTVARRVLALAREAPLASAAEIDTALRHAGIEPDPADAQQRVLRTALTRALTVVSGGPGTGKTHTLARLLGLLAHLAPSLRIAVVAPTGKAAARLGEALRRQMASASDRQSGDGRTLAAPPTMTLHRLLGARGPGAGFDTDAQQRLPYDLVIVDEASMVDVELARRLLQSIDDAARLVLAGDRDQLSSVEPGSVFADLIAAQARPVRDGVVLLERNYRQADAPGLSALSADIRDRRPLSRSFAGVEMRPLPELEPAITARVADHAAAQYLRLLDPRLLTPSQGDLFDEGRDAQAAELHRALARFRLLTALRNGPRGAVALAAAIDQRLRSALGVASQVVWYPGRAVMVTRNSAALGVANGDIGICLAMAGGQLAVAFEGDRAIRWIAVAQMPASEDAWAMTVHKSQGSEFEFVALVLAPDAHPLNTRELVYTGVTRARARLQLWGSRAELTAGIGRQVVRRSCLARRLA